jgi:hypothetical protein
LNFGAFIDGLGGVGIILFHGQAHAETDLDVQKKVLEKSNRGSYSAAFGRNQKASKTQRPPGPGAAEPQSKGI